MRIGIMAAIGEGNLGDELILESMISQLRSAFGENSLDIDIYSGDLADSQSRFKDIGIYPFLPVGVRSFFASLFSGTLFRIFKNLLSTDAVIIGGGGIFYSKETEVGINPLFIWVLRILLLRLFGIRVHIVSVGVEHVSSFDRYYLQLISYLAHTFNVRDELSLQALRDKGVRSSVSVMHDIVLDLELPHVVSDLAGAPMVLILREWGGVAGSDGVLYWKNVCEKLYARYSRPIVLVPMSYWEPDDRGYLSSISDGLSYASVWQGPYDFFSLTGLLSGAYFIMSVRLHGMVMGTKCRRPVIALGYGNKTRAFADLFGLPFGMLNDMTEDDVVALTSHLSFEREVSYPGLSLQRRYQDYFRDLFLRS